MCKYLYMLVRVNSGRHFEPSDGVIDSLTIKSTPESGARAGYDGAKKRKGSKVHAAVDTLGNLLTLHVTAASKQDPAQVGQLAEAVQQVTGENVKLFFADQGYTGEDAKQDAREQGITP